MSSAKLELTHAIPALTLAPDRPRNAQGPFAFFNFIIFAPYHSHPTQLHAQRQRGEVVVARPLTPPRPAPHRTAPHTQSKIHPPLSRPHIVRKMPALIFWDSTRREIRIEAIHQRNWDSLARRGPAEFIDRTPYRDQPINGWEQDLVVHRDLWQQSDKKQDGH
ncbi:uncharacterized protein MYCFIDRAFT_209177 [Pseudocercospora fijiensis CIRAD86]|uniref:Uncharacterized protein n=1 Tax=Pseudocercospora fijiensis (strain CIRAD86) TaxID=383855 RepID=M3AKW6_PSEFD|nr:uncharacterized protein MYCFIDRAFT_209177 [Pseudocercospora fijiensis CIRAD86]EME77768.1 hypothetical protein MYCFIDRAFT_209177 [Pseudocercospora fijiensis CIRAD86]